MQELPKAKTALLFNKETKKQYEEANCQWFKDVSSINAELILPVSYWTGHEIRA